jgi:small multidrug resistance pump
MNWLLLIIGIIMQSLCVTCMKLSGGFSNLLPTILAFVFWAVSFSMLTIVLRDSDLGYIFAIHAGCGIVLVAAIGFLFLGEPVTTLKIFAVALIAVGVACLNLK